jgi:Ca2+/Na+ antiporter
VTWNELTVYAVLIFWVGSVLSKYGDVIAEKTGLGRAWIGAILIAGVTSLPELASGVSAVAWLNAPNLPAGAVLGSCLFNLSLVAMIDLVYRPGRVLAKAQEVHIPSAGLGVLMLGIVAMGVLIGDRLAATTGLSRTFVGNLFLALTTSLPEIAASLAAIRLAAIDLAIGNVLGSNLFNITLFFVYDLADRGGNSWASLNNANGFAAVMTIIPYFLGRACHRFALRTWISRVILPVRL